MAAAVGLAMDEGLRMDGDATAGADGDGVEVTAGLRTGDVLSHIRSNAVASKDLATATQTTAGPERTTMDAGMKRLLAERKKLNDDARRSYKQAKAEKAAAGDTKDAKVAAGSKGGETKGKKKRRTSVGGGGGAKGNKKGKPNEGGVTLLSFFGKQNNKTPKAALTSKRAVTPEDSDSDLDWNDGVASKGPLFDDSD